MNNKTVEGLKPDITSSHLTLIFQKSPPNMNTKQISVECSDNQKAKWTVVEHADSNASSGTRKNGKLSNHNSP